MSSLPSPAPDFEQLANSYLAAIERGEQPDRGQLLAQYPALASQLQALFAEVDNLQTKAHLEHIDGVGSQPDVEFSLALPGAGTILAGK